MDNKTIVSPFFSIVVPVYNRSDKIASVINSIIDQSFEDWELILVDDGSKDREELSRIVESFSEPKIKLILRDNGGGGAARNTGIDAARGKFLALLDSDDTFVRDKLKLCFDVLRTDSSENTFMFSYFLVDRGLDKNWIKPERLLKDGERVDEYLTCTSGWIQTSTMVLSSSLAKRVRFSEKLPSSQDTDFAIRCYLAGAKFVFLDKTLSIMNDVYDVNRVSKQKNVIPLLSWADENINNGMSRKSSLGYKGWQCARIISEEDRVEALKLFGKAFFKGCYDFKTSVRILAQIIFKEKQYQALMNFAVYLLGGKK